MESLAPKIDTRSFEELLRQARSMAPFYTPEWEAVHEKGPGSALLKIYLHIYEQIIRRLNQAPDKNFVAFLDMMGIKMLPAQPAKALLSFTLAEGTKNHVNIPQGTQLTGEGKKESGESEEVIFQTLEDLLATPATLNEVITVHPVKDKIIKHTEDFVAQKQFTVLDENGINVQEHAFYIGHEDLLNQKGKSDIKVEFDIESGTIGVDQLEFNWEYFNGERWITLANPYGDSSLDGTDTFQRSGTLTLEKRHIGEIKATEVSGRESHWIRCRLEKELSALTPVQLPKINTIQLSVKTAETAPLIPELAFHNDIPIDLEAIQDNDTNTGIKPFGEIPRIFDTFYMANDEVFSKKGAKISLMINADLYSHDLSNEPKPVLSWEYWNGNSWAAIGLEAFEGNFSFFKEETIVFEGPNDIQKTKVNGEDKFWIRVRIIDGDYGKEIEIDGANYFGVKTVPGTIYYPIIKDLKITYEAAPQYPGYFLTHNNLMFVDYTDNCRDKYKSFEPFVKSPDYYDSLYLGFNKQLISGPLRILFSLEEQYLSEDENLKMEWFYWDGNQWGKINIADGTEGLTRIGMLEWIGSRSFSSKDLFGEDLYWIKGSVVQGGYQNPPEIKGIFLNSTSAIQSTVIKDEILGSSDGTSSQQYSFLNPLIISQEILVKEPEMPDEDEQKAIREAEGEDAIVKILDEKKEIKEIWIRWSEVDDFDNSTSGSRNYTVNKRLGIIHFGDGIHGMVPLSGLNNIKANYRFGGGKIGNVPPYAVTGLKDAIPFVETVTNHLAADSGSETETLAEVLVRGPQRLKNRDRAVTFEDFEWMAKNASRKVARARCLPNINENGEEAPGWVTVIIVPDSDDKVPEPTYQLRQDVLDELKSASANSVSAPDHIHVSGPDYIVVTVQATVVVADMSAAADAESKVMQSLNKFIHPLTGGPQQIGWEFGRKICLSEIYALIENVDDVDYVEDVVLIVDGEEHRQDILIGQDVLPVSGDHVIDMKLHTENAATADEYKDSCPSKSTCYTIKEDEECHCLFRI
jgi:hypothetical protein